MFFIWFKYIIRAWWSYLRNHNAQFWMSHFQALKNEDKFIGDFLEKKLAPVLFHEFDSGM